MILDLVYILYYKIYLQKGSIDIVQNMILDLVKIQNGCHLNANMCMEQCPDKGGTPSNESDFVVEVSYIVQLGK